jgi:hypothetical protein
MAACDYCLSDCSDDGHSLDDEDCGPSHECFHVDLGGLDEGNRLGMPEDGDPPRPAPRVDILRELAVVPVPAGVSTHSLSKSARCRRGSTRKQDNLCSSSRTSGRSGQAKLRPEKRVIWPRTSSTASPTMPGQGYPDFQWGRAEPGYSGNTTPSDAGIIHHRGAVYPGRAQEFLEDAAVRWAESSTSRRQGYPPKHRAATSQFMWEASVHTGRTRDTAPAAPGRLGNEHHRRNRRAHLDEKVR